MAEPDEPLTEAEIQTAVEALLDRTCEQVECENPAEYRFTWPGRDEMKVCPRHALKAKAVAEAIGMHLQIRPLPPL